MYNGIGLNTPRGTGTNGYVQSNVAHVKEWKVKKPDGYREILDIPAPKIKEANKDILSHEKKRKIEVEVYKYRLELEEKKIPEQEIEEQVEKKRAVLLRRMELDEMDESIKRPNDYHRSLEREKREEKKQFFNKTNKESHSIKEAQLKKNERARQILGINKDFQPGDGFDFDGERKKQREAKKQQEKEEAEKLEFMKRIEMNQQKQKVIEKDSDSDSDEEEEIHTNSPINQKKSSEKRRDSPDESRSRSRRDYSPERRSRRDYSPDQRSRYRRRDYSPEKRRKRHYSSDDER